MTEVVQHPQDQAEIDVPRSIFGFRTGCRIFMHLFSQYRVYGRHNIPKDSNFLLIGNHLSYFDAPAMGAAITCNLPGFAAKKYQDTPLKWVFKTGSPVWIEQDSPDRKAVMEAIKIIKAGHPFVLAPEGTRSKTGALIAGKEGAAFLASRTNVSILPVAVWGTEKMFHTLRPRVNVVFGKMFRLPEGRAKGDQLAEYTERMMCAIAALLPEKYRGIYKDNPLVEEMAQLVCE